MSTHSGPDIQTNGLVFAYDMSNTVRSNIGQSTTNLISNPVPTSTTGYNAAGGTGTLTFDTTSNSIRWYRIGYEVWGAYLNTPTAFNGTLSTSTQYSISFEWKSEGQVNSSALSYQLVQGNGVSPASNSYTLNSNSVDIENGWKKFKATFTPLNTGVGDAYNRVLVGIVQPSTSILDFYIRKVQFEQKSYATTFVNGTRSNTQAILDLTGKSTITATSPTYNSNGTFIFNGGTERLDISNTIGPISNNFSISAWVNSTNISATQNILSMNGPYFMRIDGSKVRFNVLAGGTWLFQPGTTTLSSNTWYNFTMVYNYDSSLWIGYINGLQEFSVAKTGTVASSSFYGYVGYTPQGGEQSNFFGQIAVVQYYNRALSAAEVKQNFNAIRGRFGI
jgi:hypothetical protein